MVLDFQLGEAIDAARALAHVPMVINHLGGVIDPRPSGAYDPRFAKWSADIAELARLPNVLMKLGGMSLFGVGMGWTASARPSSDALVAATERYFHHAINCFGPDRCMFESNFPVDRSAATYRVLWNAFKKITAHYDDREQNAMLSANAIRPLMIARFPANLAVSRSLRCRAALRPRWSLPRLRSPPSAHGRGSRRRRATSAR
jgi:predicted TIM-barrel fold metal-dependent hydrolase